MTGKRPTSIAEYIKTAPGVSQSHLRQLYAVLKAAAPKAEETVKWGNPFFVEPRFLFAFSAHKAHLSFAPSAETLVAFSKELNTHQTTKNFLQVPYNKPLPEELIRKMAKYRVQFVRDREDDSFW